jgi:hypothetical protein
MGDEEPSFSGGQISEQAAGDAFNPKSIGLVSNPAAPSAAAGHRQPKLAISSLSRVASFRQR